MTLVLIVLSIVWAAVLITPMTRVAEDKRDPSNRSQQVPDPLERPPVIRNGTARWLLCYFGLLDEPMPHDSERRCRFRGIGNGGGSGGCGGGGGGC